jgi:phosphatidylinositol glycan class M
MPLPAFAQALTLSALIRGALVLYSEYHDAHSVVKYTDVDYRVFTDAARFLLNPGKNGANGAQGWLGIPIGKSVTTRYLIAENGTE